MKHAQHSVLVFDFDGTMVDTFDQVVKVVNRLATKFGQSPLESSEVDRFRQGEVGTFFSKWKVGALLLPVLVHEVQQEQAKNMDTMREVPGLFAILRQLHRLGFRMGVVTSNSRDNVMTYLVKHRLDHLFEFVYATSLFGKEKVLETTSVEHDFSLRTALYFGDETRDIEAAKKAGMKSVAVTWGFQSRVALETTGATWVIDAPKEILSLCGVEPWWRRLFSHRHSQ